MSETAELHPKAKALVDAARRHGLDLSVREFPDGTRTAEQAAAAVGVSVAQIVKSLVFEVDGLPVLALVSGINRVDEDLLAKAADADEVSRASAETVRSVTGFPIGGVPPFGHDTHLRAFLDQDLLHHEVVWAAAGTPRHVFAISPPALQNLSEARVADIAASGTGV